LIGAGYHYGPGQERLRADRAADALRRAESAAAEAGAIAKKDGDRAAFEAWSRAEEAYSEALAHLGKDRVAEGRAVRLARAKAQMFLSKLPEARRELEQLVADASAEAKPDAAFLADARDALANSRYYMTWLMRLEGLSRDEWGPEVDAARQTYRLLNEEASRRGDVAAAKRAQENLEATVRLERMALTDLQGLPLPSQ
jgi:hypothetical protein